MTLHSMTLKAKTVLKGLLFSIPCTRKIIRSNYIRQTNLKDKIWGGGIFAEEIEENIKLFLSEKEREDAKKIHCIKNDIVECYLEYGSTPQEYFLFGFRGMPRKRRNCFLTNQHKDRKLIETVGMVKYKKELRDKYNFYRLFSEYFKRDVCKIEDHKDFEPFRQFCLKHSKFIIKPIDGMCGKGAQIREINQSDDLIKEEFYSLLNTGQKWIVEELIKQDAEMAKWNPSSVNTVRLPTFLNINGFFLLGAVFRTGRKGSIVDNAACGGIIASIDSETGTILTDGYDEKGNSFPNHPDSHLHYKGWKIPCWKELISLAKEIHHLLPSHSYIGWDFALTPNGWVLIEGDWGQFLSEFADKKGIKKEFDNLLKQKRLQL